MPELPEVEVTKQGILPHLINQRIDKIIIRKNTLRWPVPKSALQRYVSAEVIQSVSRRGKYILFEMPKGYFLIHLGMSGFLRVLDHFQPPQKHDHIDWLLESGKVLRLNDTRRFGAVLWLGHDPFQHERLSNLGVEPLDDNFTAKYLSEKAKTKSIALKTFIMDQKIVVGVGNIYANEALFLSGLHPNRPANSIKPQEFSLLCKSIKKVLRAAIKKGGTTLKDFSKADGKPGYFSQSLKIYGKEDNACPKCGTPIQVIQLGQRSTYYCESCQK